MNTTFNQYCKYLKHLLEVECAEKDLDFDSIFTSYIKAELPKLEPKPEPKLESEPEPKPEPKPEPGPTKRGDLEFEDGYYVGETKDGLMHGYGTRFWDYDDKKWEGDWEEGEACGHIVVTFGDFVVFEGDMEHGLPNGLGVYIDMNSGQRYEGNFVDFQREGEGILYTEEGDKIYDGEWKNNKYNGYGQFFLRGQCRYEGNWENGKRNGDGIAYDQNGNEEYNGPWKDDVRLNDIDWIEVASQEQ